MLLSYPLPIGLNLNVLGGGRVYGPQVSTKKFRTNEVYYTSVSYRYITICICFKFVPREGFMISLSFAQPLYAHSWWRDRFPVLGCSLTSETQAC